ncbi:hypothetical protein [Sphingopyxis indica]|uniref:Uncharacterized protein n=1 Tax=Sphingopyxis indica TaxID=436663 RepID=A0A239D1P3_9SPHN|nr:hypothetical protein [Sphingopyxis indica]SNS26260.1 hypothetical protein SAMN06295955_10144 [Sphingopyxis indica]
MVQVAAALLFALAAGLGLMVIVAMVRSNGDAILSALAGDGAFPVAAGPSPSPAPQVVVSVRRLAPRPARAVSAPRPPLSRAA